MTYIGDVLHGDLVVPMILQVTPVHSGASQQIDYPTSKHAFQRASHLLIVITHPHPRNLTKDLAHPLAHPWPINLTSTAPVVWSVCWVMMLGYDASSLCL